MDIGGLSDSVKRFEVSSPVTPRPVAGIEGHHFANEPFVHRQLVQGRWKTIIHCPKVLSLVVAASMPPKLMAQGLDPDEWIAVHLVDFVKNFSMCHELVASSGHCSINSCPTMTIGPGTSCAWRDQPSRAAPLYNDAVLTWIEGLVNDPLIFPVKAGRAFSEEFRGIAKRIWACLADLWCHLVFEHYDIFLDLSLEAYVNSLLAQCVAFIPPACYFVTRPRTAFASLDSRQISSPRTLAFSIVKTRKVSFSVTFYRSGSRSASYQGNCDDAFVTVNLVQSVQVEIVIVNTTLLMPSVLLLLP